MPTRKKAKPKAPVVDVAWFTDRARETGTSIARLSAVALGHKDLIGRSLKGERTFKPSELVDIAKALDVPVAIVLSKLGFDVPGVTCKMIGRVNALCRVSFLPSENRKEVAAPTDREVDLVALEFDTAHSVLALYHGKYLYYTPSDGVELAAIGGLSVVELGDHPAPVLGVPERASLERRRGGQASPARGRILLFGGLDPIDSEQIISAAPIRWQRMT